MRDDEIPRPRSSRKTRKWCKGKVGVEHTPKCFDYQAIKRWCGGRVRLDGWKILVCTTCGKELETYFPRRGDKPDWVV